MIRNTLAALILLTPASLLAQGGDVPATFYDHAASLYMSAAAVCRVPAQAECLRKNADYGTCMAGGGSHCVAPPSCSATCLTVDPLDNPTGCPELREDIKIPDGLTATGAEMEQTAKEIRAYNAAVNAYTACLQEQLRALNSLQFRLHDDIVGKLNALEQAFTRQLQIYNGR